MTRESPLLSAWPWKGPWYGLPTRGLLLGMTRRLGPEGGLGVPSQPLPRPPSQWACLSGSLSLSALNTPAALLAPWSRLSRVAQVPVISEWGNSELVACRHFISLLWKISPWLSSGTWVCSMTPVATSHGVAPTGRPPTQAPGLSVC